MVGLGEKKRFLMVHAVCTNTSGFTKTMKTKRKITPAIRTRLLLEKRKTLGILLVL
jgi:hypothetical protein